MKVFPIQSEKFHSRMAITIFYCLKSIGLAPFLIQTEKRIQNYRHHNPIGIFVFSKMGLFYNLIFSILLQIISIFAYPAIISLEYPDKTLLTQILDIMVFFFYIASSWFVVIYWAFKQKKATDIINRLLKAHSTLLFATNQLSFDKQSYVFISVHTVFNVILWVLIISFEYNLNSFVGFFFNIITGYVVYFFFMEYFIILGIIAKEFERLNQYLLDLKDSPNYFFRSSLPNEQLAIMNLPIDGRLATIRLLHSIRTTLFDVSQEIADFFSLPILFSIGTLFILLINCVYFLIIPGFLKIEDASIKSRIIFILWIISVFYPLILLSFNATETTKKAKLTGRVIHRLLATVRKQEIITELEQFSLQLMHEDVCFTAYGFFQLDFTFIQSVVILGATATYLVIIIQFTRFDGYDTSNVTVST